MSSKSNETTTTHPGPSSLYPLRCGDVLKELYTNVTANGTRTTAALAKSSKLWLTNMAAVAAGRGQSCHCSLLLHIPWYPCELRFCPNPTANQPDEFGRPQAEMYRCGIKACRKRFEFRFAVRDKLFCLGDFDSAVYPVDGQMFEANNNNNNSVEEQQQASASEDEPTGGGSDEHNLHPVHDHI